MWIKHHLSNFFSWTHSETGAIINIFNLIVPYFHLKISPPSPPFPSNRILSNAFWLVKTFEILCQHSRCNTKYIHISLKKYILPGKRCDQLKRCDQPQRRPGKALLLRIKEVTFFYNSEELQKQPIFDRIDPLEVKVVMFIIKTVSLIKPS